jgi:transposase
VARDPRCPDCGREGRYRDTVTRPLTDLPVAGYPLVLKVAVPRYRRHRRVRADGVQPGSREVGGTEIVDDAALRAVCVAPVDD